jgi:HPt (histidine-containing phosphotransfer) domain-containing protein
MTFDFAMASSATISPGIVASRARRRGEAVDETEKPIRLSELMSRCMNKPAFVKMLLAEFEASVPRLVTAAAGMVEDGECERAAESLHALKGATATVSAAGFHQLASAAEAFAIQGDIDALKSVMPNLCRESIACLAFITEIKTVL